MVIDLRGRLLVRVVAYSGDRGEASSSDVRVAFEFKPGSRYLGTLTLSLIDKPFFFPESAVESRIREWFAAL